MCLGSSIPSVVLALLVRTAASILGCFPAPLFPVTMTLVTLLSASVGMGWC